MSCGPAKFPGVAGLALAALVAACGGPSAEERQVEAQGLLASGKAAESLAKADEALADAAISGDAALAWRFESLRLEALAAGGKGKEVASALDRLSGKYAQQITAAMYRSLADKVAAAKDTQGAIDLLVQGDQKFPAEHASFDEAIGRLKASGDMDPATVERLRALGYLGGAEEDAAQAPAGTAAPPAAGGSEPAPGNAPRVN